MRQQSHSGPADIEITERQVVIKVDDRLVYNNLQLNLI